MGIHIAPFFTAIVFSPAPETKKRLTAIVKYRKAGLSSIKRLLPAEYLNKYLSPLFISAKTVFYCRRGKKGAYFIHATGSPAFF